VIHTNTHKEAAEEKKIKKKKGREREQAEEIRKEYIYAHFCVCFVRVEVGCWGKYNERWW